MIDKLSKMIDMKTILSFGVLIVFMVLSLTGTLGEDNVYSIILMTFTFFFGYQAGKPKSDL